MRTFRIILVLAWFVSGCQPKATIQQFEQLIQKCEYTAIMFIAPDCPLCITLSKPFQELFPKNKNYQFLGVISGQYYSPEEINMFAIETPFSMPIFRDYNYTVAKKYKISVTPEFLIINKKGEVVYQGMIDDRIEELGRYKQQWKKHYLKDALESLNRGRAPLIKKTIPVGCSLEY